MNHREHRGHREGEKEIEVKEGGHPFKIIIVIVIVIVIVIEGMNGMDGMME